MELVKLFKDNFTSIVELPDAMLNVYYAREGSLIRLSSSNAAAGQTMYNVIISFKLTWCRFTLA